MLLLRQLYDLRLLAFFDARPRERRIACTTVGIGTVLTISYNSYPSTGTQPLSWIHDKFFRTPEKEPTPTVVFLPVGNVSSPVVDFPMCDLSDAPRLPLVPAAVSPALGHSVKKLFACYPQVVFTPGALATPVTVPSSATVPTSRATAPVPVPTSASSRRQSSPSAFGPSVFRLICRISELFVAVFYDIMKWALLAAMANVSIAGSVFVAAIINSQLNKAKLVFAPTDKSVVSSSQRPLVVDSDLPLDLESDCKSLHVPVSVSAPAQVVSTASSVDCTDFTSVPVVNNGSGSELPLPSIPVSVSTPVQVASTTASSVDFTVNDASGSQVYPEATSAEGIELEVEAAGLKQVEEICAQGTSGRDGQLAEPEVDQNRDEDEDGSKGEALALSKRALKKKEWRAAHKERKAKRKQEQREQRGAGA